VITLLETVRAERPGQQLSHGASKTRRLYWDLVVGGKPLSSLLPQTLDLISPLGWGSPDFHRRAQAELLLEGPASFSEGRRALLVCPECGDLGCGAISAIIEKRGQLVVWRDFGYQTNYEGTVRTIDLEPLTFDWDRYSATIQGTAVRE